MRKGQPGRVTWERWENVRVEYRDRSGGSYLVALLEPVDHLWGNFKIGHTTYIPQDSFTPDVVPVKPRGITHNGGRKPGSGTNGRPTQVPFNTTIDPRLLAVVKASGRRIVDVVREEIGKAFPGWDAEPLHVRTKLGKLLEDKTLAADLPGSY